MSEDAANIQNLTNEIGLLKIENDLNNFELQKLNGLYADAKQSLIIIQDELENIPAAPVIGEDQVIVTIPPIIAKALEIESANFKKRNGEDLAFGELLAYRFWDSILEVPKKNIMPPLPTIAPESTAERAPVKHDLYNLDSLISDLNTPKEIIQSSRPHLTPGQSMVPGSDQAEFLDSPSVEPIPAVIAALSGKAIAGTIDRHLIFER